MSIHRTQKDNAAKHLKLIQSQLYGRIVEKNLKPQELSSVSRLIKEDSSRQSAVSSDIVFFRKDLRKIMILSTLAIGAQLLLYFSSLNKLIKLPI